MNIATEDILLVSSGTLFGAVKSTQSFEKIKQYPKKNFLKGSLYGLCVGAMSGML